MDGELLLDIFAFCPEKYFVHKVIFSQTRVSFVDYERKFYLIDGCGIWRKKYKESPPYQEYGPSIDGPHYYAWAFNGGLYRKNGVSLILKAPQDLWGGDLPYYIVSDYNIMIIPKFWDIEPIRVKEMWIDRTTLIKAKVLEEGKEIFICVDKNFSG